MPLTVCFLHSDKARERVLADAFLRGASTHGDHVELRPLTPDTETIKGVDIVCMVGVKSKRFFDAYAREGATVVMLDKGYARHGVSGAPRSWEYWRVAVNAHHPTRYLMDVKRPSDRWDRLGLEFAPWRERGKHILLAGSSEKYHDFYGLRHPTVYAQKIVKRMRAVSERKIVYRPKPSWRGAEPIAGTTWDDSRDAMQALQGAWALVTHGSNACFEANLLGIPSVILGDAVAKPLSSNTEEDVVEPRLASEEDRAQWFANLAYCQWTMREMASGEAWQHIRPLIYA
jgi:hypothetical protein